MPLSFSTSIGFPIPVYSNMIHLASKKEMNAYLLEKPVDLVAYASSFHAYVACLTVSNASSKRLHGLPLHHTDLFVPAQVSLGLRQLLFFLLLQHIFVCPEQLLPVCLPHSLGGRSSFLGIRPVNHQPISLFQLCLCILESFIKL